ncbi:MAG: hypothetical protein IPL98_17715 [Saprospiraceae bacterium]|jgi:hypothetical protein|nr:hypothetical protein [Saprospiraceae bacterium]
MTNSKKISRNISQREVEKRVDAQYEVIQRLMRDFCLNYDEHCFDDRLHVLTHGYTADIFGEEDIIEAMNFIDALRLLVRAGRAEPQSRDEMEERINNILCIDSGRNLEDLLYKILEASCMEDSDWENAEFTTDMFFMARMIKELLRECAKLTGHDKE